MLRNAALSGDLVEQNPVFRLQRLVSTDLVGNSCASIVDSPATIVSKDNKSAVLCTSGTTTSTVIAAR